MADDYQVAGERLEYDPVTIAHLGAIPKCVVVIFAEMNAGDQLHSLTVQRIALVFFKVELVGVAGPVIGLIDLGIAGGPISFLVYQRAGKRGLFLAIIDLPVRLLWVIR